MSLSAGMMLGPYEIVSLLGAGGMGEVYRARDTRLKRAVAIKVLPADSSGNTERRRRMELEAQAISHLSHPHICTLYDIGNSSNLDFLVMEFLEGQTLADQLKKGPLPWKRVLPTAMEILDALDSAHRNGIIHRDLKPANIMLTASGVKLLDFGLAKLRLPESETNSMLSTANPSLTAEGSIFGTVPYMSPEQLEGKEIDARSDLFSFGVVLYEMITGQPAFSGNSQASVMAAILGSDPRPISSFRSETPAGFDHILRRCLAKKPEDRWQTARDVMLELKWISSNDSNGVVETSSGPVKTKWSRLWIATTAMFLVLSVVLGFAYLRRKSPESTTVRFTVSPPTQYGFSSTIALSPDGKNLAYVAPNPDGRDALWIRRLDAIDSRLLAGTESAAYPFWSPDSRSIAFFADGKLKKFVISESSVLTLCTAPDPRGGTWSTKNVILFSANSGAGLDWVPAAGGVATPLKTSISGESQIYARWPHFLPDGLHFVFYSFSSTIDNPGIAVGTLDSTEARFLTPADSGGEYVSPGYLLFLRGDTLMRQPFDKEHLQVEGDATPLAEKVWSGRYITALSAFSAAANGVLAYRSGGIEESQYYWFDRNGNSLGSVGPPSVWAELDLSPDEKSILTSNFGSAGIDIWQIDLQRGVTTKLTTGPEFKVTPLWAPDGLHFGYTSFPEGTVYEATLGGSGKKMFHLPGGFAALSQWTPDGRYVFIDMMDLKAMKTDLWVMPLFGDQKPYPFRKTDFNEQNGQLSPDGHWLAYVSDESGPEEVYVQSFPVSGVKRRISTNGGTTPSWRGDGKELFYVGADNKIMSVEIRTEPEFEANLPKALFRTRMPPMTEARNHYVAISDGQRFLVNTLTEQSVSSPIVVVLNWNTGAQ